MTSHVALITGASSGIGAATATRLASAGFTVYGAARRSDRIAELPGVIPVAMDITDEGQVQAAVDRIMAEQGRLDVLVNNAGFAQYGPVEEVPLADRRHHPHRDHRTQAQVALHGRLSRQADVGTSPLRWRRALRPCRRAHPDVMGR